MRFHCRYYCVGKGPPEKKKPMCLEAKFPLWISQTQLFLLLDYNSARLFYEYKLKCITYMKEEEEEVIKWLSTLINSLKIRKEIRSYDIKEAKTGVFVYTLIS
jgi:hypothetical protein